jgi:O-antigen ligase
LQPAGARPPEDRPSRAGFWLYAAHLWAVFASAVSNVLLGLTVLVAPWSAPRSAAAWRPWRGLLRPLGVYVLALVVSIAASYEPRRSLGALSEVFSLATILLALVLVRGERPARRIVDGLIVVSSLFALSGLAQFLWDFGGINNRIRGPFSHYMTFSGVLLVADLLLGAQMVASPQARRSAWRWAATLLLNLALLGSLTRSAWMGVLVGFTLLVLLRSPKLLLAYLPAAALFVLLAPVPVLSRALSIAKPSDRSNYDRLCMVKAGVRMVSERPLFGLGPDLVKRRYPIYREPTAPRFTVPHLHNSVLQLTAERGIVSLAAYLWLMGAGLWIAWRRFRAEGGPWGGRADLYLGVLAALVGFNFAGLFENNWGDTEVQRLVLFVMALPLCAQAREPERAEVEPAESSPS